MRQSEYQNIFKNEDGHYYYIGIHNEILSLVGKYFPKNNFKENIKILDAGCGTGLLAKKLGQYGQVFGVDISPDAVKFTKKRNVRVVKAPVEKIPFANNYFDLIVSVDVLYHSGVDESKALEEFHRVLKPHGTLILKLPAFDFLKGKHDIVVQTARRYTKGTLSTKLFKARFKETRSTYIASFLFLPALVKRSLERFLGLSEKEAESDLKMPPQIVNRLLVLLFNMENFLLNYMDLPFGLSLLIVAKKK